MTIQKNIIEKTLSLFIRGLHHLTVIKTEDEYLNWLRFANAGMLHPGNIHAMKHAITNLPTSHPIVEIGSFCGLSANVISYLLEQNGKKNLLLCSDKWVFERYDNNLNLGKSKITHIDYSNFVKETFARNI